MQMQKQIKDHNPIPKPPKQQTRWKQAFLKNKKKTKETKKVPLVKTRPRCIRVPNLG